MLLPFPPRLDASHGGSRAIAQLAQGLAEQHEVALLYLRNHGDPDISSELHDKCAHTEAIAFSSSRATWLGKNLIKLRNGIGLFRGFPTWVTAWNVEQFETRLRAFVQEWNPDVVQAEYHIMGQYLSNANTGSIPRVLVQYEPGYSTAQERLRNARRLTRVRAWLEHRAWVDYEHTLTGNVDAVVTLTQRDMEVMQDLQTSTPIHVIPLGAVLPDHPLNPLGEDSNLLFVGSFIHPPNVDAAFHLARNLFPAIQSRNADAKLVLVGDRPPESLRRLQSTSITITGFVSDVIPYLDQAALVLAPLRLGGGMRVKVLEALGAGKAIVATPLAVEGLQVENGRHLAIAGDDDAFVEEVVRLLENTNDRVRLAAQARLWAEQNLSWDPMLQTYNRLYTSLIASPRDGERY